MSPYADNSTRIDFAEWRASVMADRTFSPWRGAQRVAEAGHSPTLARSHIAQIKHELAAIEREAS